jgi:hypothetical protein
MEQVLQAITTFTNSSGVAINIIKSYGQIDKVMLKTACEKFCKAGEVNAESRAKQNNTMISMCLNNSLTATAKASLLIYVKYPHIRTGHKAVSKYPKVVTYLYPSSQLTWLLQN